MTPHTFILPLMLALLGVAKASYVAEVYFVVEPQVVKNYMKNLGYDKPTAMTTVRKDIDFIVFEINNYYKSLQRFGLNLEIRAKKVEILFENEKMFDDCLLINGKELQADLALARIKEWLKEKDSQKVIGYDMALVWTGYDVFGGSGEKMTSGYASVKAVCDPTRNVGIAEFLGNQNTAVTTAHEIAHSLGGEHDQTSVCRSEEGYIMTPTLGAQNPHRWEFSYCTFLSIDKNMKRLTAAGTNCLSKTTTPAKPFDIASQNGRDIMNPEKICQRFRQDKNSYFCRYDNFYKNHDVRGDLVCQYLYCAAKGSSTCGMAIPTEGMECDVGKRCNKGRCVKAQTNFPTTNNDKDCIYGDLKSNQLFGTNHNCESYLAEKGLSYCYQDTVKRSCCATCNAKKSNIPGCEFGDRSTFCAKYNPDMICGAASNRKVCCYTCRNKPSGRRSAPDFLVPTIIPDSVDDEVIDIQGVDEEDILKLEDLDAPRDEA